MACGNVMVPAESVISINPDATVGEAIEKLMKNSIRTMPVLDQDGKYLGIFNFQQILGALLPKSATLNLLDHLGFLTDSEQDVLDKMREVKNMAVSEIMTTEKPVLYKDTALWEALLMMYKFEAPLPVVDRVTGHLEGLMSKQSAITDLQKQFLKA